MTRTQLTSWQAQVNYVALNPYQQWGPVSTLARAIQPPGKHYLPRQVSGKWHLPALTGSRACQEPGASAASGGQQTRDVRHHQPLETEAGDCLGRAKSPMSRSRLRVDNRRRGEHKAVGRQSQGKGCGFWQGLHTLAPGACTVARRPQLAWTCTGSRLPCHLRHDKKQLRCLHGHKARPQAHIHTNPIPLAR